MSECLKRWLIVPIRLQGAYDLTTGEDEWHGIPYRITLPGIGPLLLEAGRSYFDGETVYHSGVFMFPEDGTGSALCEALAP